MADNIFTYNGRIPTYGGGNYIPYFQTVDGCTTLTYTKTAKTSSSVANNESIGFSLNGYLYAKGGGTGGINGTCERYDPVGNSWSSMATGYVGRGSSSFTIGTMSFVVGGYNTGYLNTLEMYDDISNTWISKTNCPMNVYRPGAFSDGTYGYVAGGEVSGSGTTLCYRYDPVANTWTAMTSLPAAVKSYSQTFVLNGNPYVIAAGTQKKVYRYNIGANTWTTMNDFPINLGGGTGFVINDLGYVVNGANTVYNNDLYLYDESLDSWSVVMSSIADRNSAAGGVVDCKFYMIRGNNATINLKTCEEIS